MTRIVRQDMSHDQSVDLSRIYRDVPVGLCCLDSDLRFIHINEQLAAINGLPISEHLDRTVGEVLPEFATRVEPMLREVLETGEPVSDGIIDLQTPADPGVMKTCQYSFLPVKSRDGTVTAVTCVVQDVTERLRAEQARHDAEIQSRALLEGSPVCNKIVDLDSRLRFMSAAGVRALKIDDIESLYGCIYPPAFYPESMREPLIKHMERARAGETCSVESPVLDMEGNELWYHTTFVPACDDEGRVEYIMVSSVNVTERRRAEVALRESEERLGLALDATKDGVWDWNIVTGEVQFSPQWFRSLGYEPGDLASHVDTWEKIVHPDDIPRLKEARQAHFDGTTENYEIENRLLTGSGTWQWNLVRGKVVERDKDGNPVRMVGTDSNISNRKRNEEERRRLEKMGRQQESELIHMGRVVAMGEMATGLAHELNQPLAAIANFAAAAQIGLESDRGTKEKVISHLTQIAEQAARCANIIKGLQTFARKAEPVSSQISVIEPIREVITMLNVELRHNQVRVREHIDPQLTPVMGDAVQLQQVMLNLIQNAIYAMQDVAADNRELSVSASQAEPDQVEISVSDTGPGIEQESIDNIFRSFFSTRPGGLGMGLSISRTIIEAHGGSIEASRNPTCGMTFRIRLPAAAETQRPS